MFELQDRAQKNQKIVPLCTHGCFAHAALFVHQSYCDSKSTVIQFLAGKLNVCKGTAWRSNLTPCNILELASSDAHKSPHLHRAKNKWKLFLTGSNVILLLYIFFVGNKQKERVLKGPNVLILKSNQSHCLGFGYPLLEAIDDFVGHT